MNRSEPKRDEVESRDPAVFPFLIRVESLELPNGDWHRQVSCPEVGVHLEGLNLVEMLDDLERLVKERTATAC